MNVVAVSRGARHGLTKRPVEAIRLIAGEGVEGDAHRGDRVRHRSRARRDPTLPNLRQVHLIGAELYDELVAAGFEVAAGDLGENVCTRGADLLGRPVGTRVALGADAVVALTGLRNPCSQLDGVQPGLMEATLGRDEAGALVRKAGVMAVVLIGGEVRPGDPVAVEPGPGPHRALEPV